MAAATDTRARTLRLSPIVASREALAPYATFLGTEVDGGLSIPFYRGSIVEGHALPFECPDPPVVRTATVSPRAPEVLWLERHVTMTQLFVGLGGAPFAMVLGKPNHDAGLAVPEADGLALFHFPAGHGCVLHLGTWHDFPMALRDPVTVLTVSSSPIVGMLASAEDAHEIDAPDVLKIEVERALGVRLTVDLSG